MTELLSRANRILLDGGTQRSVAAIRRKIDNQSVAELSITLASGEKITCEPEAAKFLQSVIAGTASGKLTIDRESEWVTTTVASDLLGVTRPTLRKWVERGLLSDKKVGSHQKLRLDEVLKLREAQLQERKAAFNDLRQFEEEHLPVQN